MVTKGAVEEMLAVCSFVECDGEVQSITETLRRRILDTVDELNDKGFRVLAIAQKSNPSPASAFGVKDECDMVFMGYLAFLDDECGFLEYETGIEKVFLVKVFYKVLIEHSKLNGYNEYVATHWQQYLR